MQQQDGSEILDMRRWFAFFDNCPIKAADAEEAEKDKRLAGEQPPAVLEAVHGEFYASDANGEAEQEEAGFSIDCTIASWGDECSCNTALKDVERFCEKQRRHEPERQREKELMPVIEWQDHEAVKRKIHAERDDASLLHPLDEDAHR